MHALLLTWDLHGSPELLGKLRHYITDESWARYRTVDGLFHKAWLSSADPYEFSAFYLWETIEARENEVERMHRVKEITGVDATIWRWDVEAVQEGVHSERQLTTAGPGVGAAGSKMKVPS